MSVYTESARAAGAREGDEVVRLKQETEEDTDESYGPLKALCEDVVRGRFANAFVPRPGLIVGPWDPTGRFTYWPTRFAAGGFVLAPSPSDAPVQLIDARDLANWIVEAADQDGSGTYNAISPPMTMVDVLETCRRVAGTDAALVWVDGEFLTEQQVGPWMELPLWVGPEEGGFMRASVERALANGLRIRRLEETVADTLEWVQSGEAPNDPPAGLAREKEQRVFDAWRSNQ
jgi:2'-hydroxyisoflavone reductase